MHHEHAAGEGRMSCAEADRLEREVRNYETAEARDHAWRLLNALVTANFHAERLLKQMQSNSLEWREAPVEGWDWEQIVDALADWSSFPAAEHDDFKRKGDDT